MVVTLTLSQSEVTALNAKRVATDEPLSVIIRRLLSPLFLQFVKEQRAARIRRMVLLFQQAAPDTQTQVLDLLQPAPEPVPDPTPLPA